MNIYNHTQFNHKAILDLMAYCKVPNVDWDVYITDSMPLEAPLAGTCVSMDGCTVINILDNEYILETLVHELEHLRQHIQYKALNNDPLLERRARKREYSLRARL